MKKSILLFLVLFIANSYSQNFTDSQSFINYIEGEWEKVDSLTINTIYDQNVGNYLRLKFERVVGSDSSVNVSAYGNTYSTLNLSLNCSLKEIGLDTDPLFYSFFLNLHPSNQNLMYRFDSLDFNNLVLKKRMHFWDDYSYVYNFTRVNSNDTLVIGQTCNSSNIQVSPIVLGCNNDTVYIKKLLQSTLFLEKSTFNMLDAGTATEHFNSVNNCDSIVVTTTNLLDSNSLEFINFMHGTWEWVYTHSGWSSSFADSLNYKINMKIFKTESLNNMPYSIYSDGTLQYCAKYYYLSNFRLADYSGYSNPIYPTTYNCNIIGDTILALIELLVYDGPTHYWKKISNSTNSFVSISTCNVDEVGIDSTYNNTCDSSLMITNTYYDCPNSISNLNNESLILTPNPAKNFIVLNLDIKILEVYVFDINGKQVTTQRSAELLDVSTLSKGLYFIKVQSENNILSGRFVKE